MRLLVLLLLFLPMVTFSQDCLTESDIVIKVQPICNNDDGQIEIQIINRSLKLKRRQLALFNVNLNDFERNVLDEEIIFQSDRIIFPNIGVGEYRIAFYGQGCQDFPKPIMLPSRPLVMKVDSDCQ